MLYFSLIILGLSFPKLYLDQKNIEPLFFLNAFTNHISDHISPDTWIYNIRGPFIDDFIIFE